MRDFHNGETPFGFALALDVDGVLTNDTVHYSDNSNHAGTGRKRIGKSYCTEDFQALKAMLNEGLRIYIITGEFPQLTRDRLMGTGLSQHDNLFYFNVGSPDSTLLYFREKTVPKGYDFTHKSSIIKYITDYRDEDIHYIGDSIFTDLPIIKLCNSKVKFYTPFESYIHKWSSQCIVLNICGGKGVVVEWYMQYFTVLKEENRCLSKKN